MIKHYMYIGLIMALLAFGYWYTDQADQGGFNRCVASYESQLRKDLNEQINKAAELQASNDQLVLDLLNKQPEIRTVYKTIERKVNVYVKDNPDCNLTRGAVSLRNSAGDPEYLRPGYHPALSESDAGGPSTVTQRAAEQQIHEWGRLYNELSGRYKALLEVKVCKAGGE